MSNLPDAIFLMGPTASGKTDLAIKLCQVLPCEIISVDSALVYKGMDIGTAKPTAAELAQAPHRLIDLLDPAQAYSAADFCRDATRHIKEIQANGRIPLLVGGTMLYFKALLEGLSPLPKADQSIRSKLEKQAEIYGWQALHDELREIDPISAERIHPNDPQRLLRALEVFRISGKSMTELTETKGQGLTGNIYQFAIAPEDRKVLHHRIEQRFEQMLVAGFEDEVKALYARDDLHKDLPAIRCVGYRQMWEYLDGDLDYNEMVYRGVVATRQLSKRQMTWLRGWPDVIWLDSLASNNVKNVIDNIELS